MNPKLIAVMALWKKKKHLSGAVSNLEPIPQCYGFMITSFDHLSIYATKRERKLLMSTKQNENLNKQNLSFLMTKPLKKSYSKNNFSNYFTFFANRNK
jgi:hypothetical protein